MSLHHKQSYVDAAVDRDSWKKMFSTIYTAGIRRLQVSWEIAMLFAAIQTSREIKRANVDLFSLMSPN